MKPVDLTPEGVDALPEREFVAAIDILPDRPGHFVSPYKEHLQLFGETVPDTSGVVWTVREDGNGVFKSRADNKMCGTCRHWNEEKGRWNPPGGLCVWPGPVPVWVDLVHNRIMFGPQGKECPTWRPKETR